MLIKSMLASGNHRSRGHARNPGGTRAERPPSRRAPIPARRASAPHQLERALQALPGTAPARGLLQQRLSEVLAEQESRIIIIIIAASEHA
jgi:hypothetical protein